MKAAFGRIAEIWYSELSTNIGGESPERLLSADEVKKIPETGRMPNELAVAIVRLTGNCTAFKGKLCGAPVKVNPMKSMVIFHRAEKVWGD